MSASDGRQFDVVQATSYATHPPDKKSGPRLLGHGCCIVKDGIIEATYYAPGFSWDASVLHAEFCYRLLKSYLSPTATVMVHATGLSRRVRDIANSKNGINSQGRPYAGLKYFQELIAANDAGRLAFRDLDKHNFVLWPAIRSASFAAERGREEALGMAAFMRTIWGTERDFLATEQFAGNFNS